MICGRNARCSSVAGDFYSGDVCKCDYEYEGNPYLPHGCQGCCVGFGGIFLVIFSWWLYRLLRRRRIKKQKQTFFKRNGGLLLQQFSPADSGFEKSRIFSEEELLKATDEYNENRILEKGGQGTIFKGMMTDGRIVAVKKSKIENSRAFSSNSSTRW